MSVQIIGADGVHKMLADYTSPKLPRRLQLATKAGAQVFKAPVVSEARKVSKRLARSVSVRNAKRDKPASVVTFRPKVAFFRHFVIDGTRDHGPRRARMLAWSSGGQTIFAKHVRGVKPNPIIERIAPRYEAQAYRAIDQALDKTETT